MRKSVAALVLSVALFCGFAMVAGKPFAKENTTVPPLGGVPAHEGIKMLEAGAAAPDFTVKDLDGKPFRLSGEKGKKPFLLVFWSIFCEPCRLELPLIQKMHGKYREGGLEVLAVVLDGEPLTGSITGFMKQEGYSFRVLVDELDSREMFKVADPYGVAATPTIYILDRTGKVVFARAGRVPEEELEKAVQAVLKK